jgi:hypothetical protein
MMNEETKRQPARDGVNSSFIILHSSFPHAMVKSAQDAAVLVLVY